ncbi:hypothetical protein JMA_39110 (plasmid) [Jeotgalibacillus malaysiensis]|uniref:Uncharacterized protein n=1 Tax=Jeotgalibacillus malaysiensis TaxID=1508404 RepID=A0A0B5AZ29_9BACL|nr:hypothetical protein [Jeotgalibacillus malaysiensis]AJD93229.1 hypothetical protein JMA_39110 [Jeotgalibacillus malaysiensis]
MSKQKKYEMLRVNSKPNLYLIKALIDIPKWDVEKGETGGMIEHEGNLSQDGDGWIGKGSFVKGSSSVINGLVSGQSSLLEAVILKNGVVRGTKLKGNILIDGSILFDNSEIYGDSSFSGRGFISDSVIANGNFDNQFKVKDSNIEAENGCRFEGVSNFTNASINVYSAYISHDCTMKHVQILTPQMESNQEFIFEYIDVDNESRVTIGEKSGQAKGRSIMCGSEAEKVMVRGKHFRIHNSKITGSPTITGAVTVKNSTISGMPTIEMRYGRILDSTIEECAVIKSSSIYMKEINGKRICGDTVYDFDTH